MISNRLRTILMVGMCVFALTTAFLVVTEGTVLSEDDTSFSRAADLDFSSPATSDFSSTSFSNEVVESDSPYLGTSVAEVVNQAGIDRLIAATGGEAKVDVSWVTGLVSFIQLPQGVTLAFDAATPEDAAMAFFAEYGDLFAITSAENELALMKSTIDARGYARLTFQQVYEGVAVFGATLQVSVTPDNEIASVNGNFIPVSEIATAPALGADEVAEIAMEMVRTLPRESHSSEVMGATASRADFIANDDDFEIGELSVATNLLYVYHDGLLMGVPGQLHLAYEVQVVNEFLTIRDFLVIDALSGELLNKWEAIHLIEREIYEESITNKVWDEGDGDPDPIPAGWESGTAAQVTAWQNEIDGAVETYNMFASMTGGDYLSYDGADAIMKTVNNDPIIDCPNANWNGVSTNYCNGVTGDDTVAHEWGHAYTEYNSNLIYQWQSGALNESYSDVWGEVVDLLNGRGTDSPGGLRSEDACSIYGVGSPSTDDSYRWLSGEDDPAFGGAIRDMWNPGCYGDPNQVIDSNYYCASTDGGGVHTNSGVPNRAFAIMVDGLPSEGIPALGLTKSAHIFWLAQTDYLTNSSNFADFAGAIEQSCQDLVGTNLYQLTTGTSGWGNLSGEVITSAECDIVEDITELLQLRTSPAEQCGFEPLLSPEAPGICEALGNVETIALEDWESGLGAWTVGTRDVANPGTFDEEDWAVVSELPAGRPGSAAFVGDDPALGDCAADDESGVLYMESPVFNLPNDPLLVPRIAIDHYVATELGWDGGNIKISINGGDWELLPASAFEFNPYNDSLETAGAGNTNPLAGEPAYTGTDEGDVTGSWGRSYVNLSGLAYGGDTVQLRFEEGQDGCNGVIGWFVDDVHVYSCELEELGMSCGDGILDAGETCDDGNTNNGDGCSSVCFVESNYTCSAPTDPDPLGTQIVLDPSFETGSPNAAWDEYSINFGTPLCTTDICSGPGGTDGDWFVWFGGISGVVEGGYVSQSVEFPTTATEIQFDYLVGLCDTDSDYIGMWIDEDPVWLYTCAEGTTTNYQTATVDITPYADGGVHEIYFESFSYSNDGGSANFFLDYVRMYDNVSAAGEPSVCEPNPEIDIDPDSVYSLQYPDEVKIKQFTISNVGAGVLSWSITEDNKAATAVVQGYATDVPEVAEPTAVAFTGAVSKVSSLPKSVGGAVAGSTIETASGQTIGSGGGSAADASGVLEPGYYLFTESAELDPIGDNSVACGSGSGESRVTSENWYLRQFDLINDFDVTSSIDIDRLYFGVEAVNIADMQIYLIVSITDDLTTGSILGSLAGVYSLTLPVGTETGVYSIEIAPIHVPAGSTVVYGIISFGDEGGAFYAGSNTAGESGPSYLAAPGCGFDEPIPTAAIGYPDMNLTLHYLAEVNDDFLTCTYPEDVPWITGFSPLSASILAGPGTPVNVWIDSTGYTSGIYEATLCVESNDATDPLVQVPVTMEVIENGSITIVKDAQPDTTANFRFDYNYGRFWLDDDNNAALKDSLTIEDLPPGNTYFFTEKDNNNWKLADIVCDSDNSEIVVDLETKTAYITLGSGDDVTCTFINQKTSKLRVRKFLDYNENGVRDGRPREPWGGGWEFTVYDSEDNQVGIGVTNSNGMVVFNWLPAGDYKVCETDARLGNGWYNTEPGEDACTMVTLGIDDNVLTFFGNAEGSGAGEAASLTIQTTVDWSGIRPRAKQKFEVCIYGNTTAAYTCATVGSTGGTVIFNDLVPDTYSWWQVNPGANWSVSGWGTAPLDLSKGGDAVVGIDNTFLIPDATSGTDGVQPPAETPIEDVPPAAPTGPRSSGR